MSLRSDLHANQLVAVKDGRPADELRREADLLADLSHRGIIRFVALTGDEQAPRLLTEYAGRETLATWRPKRMDELARVFAELAEAVHYLHSQGVVHRAIRPTHVIVDAQRRPLLCGFSAALRDGEADLADARLADVAAVGTTLQGVLDGLADQPQRAGRRRDDQRLRERLRSAAQAAADGRVPSARALAGQFLAQRPEVPDRPAAGPGTGGNGGPGPIPRSRETLERIAASRETRSRAPRRRIAGRHQARDCDPRTALRRAQRGRRRPRRPTVVAAAVVCAGCTLGALMVTRLADDRPASPLTAAAGTLDGSGAPATGWDAGARPPTGSAPADITTTEAQLSHPASGSRRPTAATAGENSDACRPVAHGFRDITGDGCAEGIVIDSGAVLVDGARYPVGEADDQVAVGDWDCDGVATVALVQRAGRVYIFDGWPERTPLVGELVADLAPPVQLADVPRGTCNELVVHYAEGTWHLPIPPPPDWAAGNRAVRRPPG